MAVKKTTEKKTVEKNEDLTKYEVICEKLNVRNPAIINPVEIIEKGKIIEGTLKEDKVFMQDGNYVVADFVKEIK